MNWLKMTLMAALVAFIPVAGFSVEPDEILDNPVLEARARAISAEVRCVVCQNESIDTSNAGIARDLRILIRERLVAGDSDQLVLDFLVARYGDFVLLKPPFKPETYALWFGPILIIIFGAGGIALMMRRINIRRAQGVPGLDPADEAEVARLLKNLKEEPET
jgi:cytochrome c-type biogenesis protein CcmH